MDPTIQPTATSLQPTVNTSTNPTTPVQAPVIPTVVSSVGTPVMDPMDQVVPMVTPSLVSTDTSVPVASQSNIAPTPQPSDPIVVPVVQPPMVQEQEVSVTPVIPDLSAMSVDTPIVTDVPPALAQSVVQAQAVTPAQSPIGSAKGKELGPVASQELAGFVEVVGSDSIEKEPLPPEVSSWMEKVSRDTSGEKPPEVVVADQTAQAPTSNYSSQPVFVLPLGEAQMQSALHQSVNNSVRWLAEWCKKIAKKLGQGVAYNG